MVVRELPSALVVAKNRPDGDESARDVSRLRLCSHEVQEETQPPVAVGEPFPAHEEVAPPRIVPSLRRPGEGLPGVPQRARRYLHLRDLDEAPELAVAGIADGEAPLAPPDGPHSGNGPGKRLPRPPPPPVSPASIWILAIREKMRARALRTM